MTPKGLRSFGRRSQQSIAVVCASTVAVLGMGVARASAVTPAKPAAASEDQPSAEQKQAPKDPSVKRADAVVPQFQYFSSALMSPSANGANPYSSANIVRMVKVTVSKPKDGNTKLTINPNPDPAAPKMLISNQGGNVALTTALGQVCGGNPIEGTPYRTIGYSSITCTLNAKSWDTSKPPVDSTEQSTIGGPTNEGVARQVLVGQAQQSAEPQRTIPIGLIPLGQHTLASAAASSERAKNLDAWLQSLPTPNGGGAGIPDEGGDKDVFVNDFVTVTDASGSKVEAAPLTWKQCYLKKSTEDLFRAACTPDSMYTLNFAPGPENERSGGLPAETTANESLGVINPGDTWKGTANLLNNSSSWGYAGQGPFTTPGGPRTDATGKSTPYMLADVLPRYVTDMTANDQKNPLQSAGDCRELPAPGSGKPTPANPALPDELKNAQSICGITQGSPHFVTPLTAFGAPTIPNPWNQPNNKPQVGSARFNVGYTVPIDVLKDVANDPSWKLEMQDVKVPVYKNDKGEELKTPELKTEQVPQYVSTSNPTAWAYVPATCANKGGVRVCAADARNSGQGLKLVKVATADTFERRICGTCWPSPRVYENEWTYPDTRTAAARKARGTTSIMQGQSAFLSVQGVNQSQTPGHYSDLTVAVDRIPKGITVIGTKFIKLPDGKKPKTTSSEAEPPTITGTSKEPVNLWRDAPADVFDCTTTDSTVQPGTTRTTCKLKPASIPAVAKYAGNKQWVSGKYAALFKVAASDDAPPTAENKWEAIESSYEYPNFKNGQPAFGTAAADHQKADFVIISKEDAGVAISAQVPDPAALAKWSPYDGAPVQLKVGSSAKPGEDQSAVRFVPTNDGHRWVKPGGELAITVAAPPGVNFVTEGNNVAARTDYDLDGPGDDKPGQSQSDNDQNQLTKWGEKWTCGPVRNASREMPVHGSPRQWQVQEADCTAKVSTARLEGWKGGVLRAPAGQFPAIVLPVKAAQESASMYTKVTGQIKATYNGERVSADSEITKASADVEAVDADSSAPTVEPYWVVRPVAGGHAQLRVDVANVNRGAANDMSVLVDLGPGVRFDSMGTDPMGDKGWSCKSVVGSSRVACTYFSQLAAHRPPTEPVKDEKAKKDQWLDLPRTRPLYIKAKVADSAAGKTFNVTSRASVLKISNSAELGSDGGALSRPIGNPLKVQAEVATGDKVENGYKVEGTTLDLTKTGVNVPKPEYGAIRLDASKTQPAFEGQPLKLAWRQICVPGESRTELERDEIAAKCGGLQSKPVNWVGGKPTAESPAFVPAVPDKPTDYWFQVTAADDTENLDMLPRNYFVSGSATKGNAVVDARYDAKSFAVPNTARGYVKVTVDPPPKPEAPQASPTEEPSRNAGGAETDVPQNEDSVIGKDGKVAANGASPSSPPASAPKQAPKADVAAKAVEECKTYLEGNPLSLGDYVSKVGYENDKCVLKGIKLKVDGWLEVDGDISFDKKSVTLGNGTTFVFPKMWNVKEDKDFKVEVVGKDPVVIPFPGKGATGSGTVKLSGAIPFADKLDQLGKFEKKELTLGFGQAGGTTVGLEATGGDSKLTFETTVAKGGLFSLKFDAKDPFEIPRVDSFALTGNVSYQKPEGKPEEAPQLTYTVSGGVKGVKYGDALILDSLDFSADKASGDLAITGAATVAADSGQGVVVQLSGSRSEANGLTINGGLKNFTWAAIGQAIDATVDLKKPTAADKFAGAVSLVTAGQTPIAGGAGSIGDLGAKVAFDAAGNTNTEATARVVMTNSKKQSLDLVMDGAASYQSGKLNMESLSAKQAAGEFELVPGLSIEGASFSVVNVQDPATRAVTISGDSAKIDGWLALKGYQVASDPTGFKVSKGSVVLEKGMVGTKEDLTISVDEADPLTFPKQGSATGTLSANVVPFNGTFESLPGLELEESALTTKKTTLSLGNKGAVSLKVEANGDGDKTLGINGVIAPDKSFTLDLNAKNVFTFGSAENPVVGGTSLGGKIAYSKATGLNYDNIYGSLNDLNIGDYLTSKEVKIERKKDGAQNVLTFSGDGALGSPQDEKKATIKINGHMDAQMTEIGAQGTVKDWPGLPGELEAGGEYILNKATKKFSGAANLTAPATVAVVPDQVTISRTGVSFKIDEDGNKEVGAAATVNLKDVNNDWAKISLAGKATSKGSEGYQFDSVSGTTPSEEPFELIKGLKINGLSVTLTKNGANYDVAVGGQQTTFGDWLNFKDYAIKYTAAGIEISKGTAELPAEKWGGDGLTFEVKEAEPVKIARDGATTGTIYGTGVPFKSQLEKLPIGDNLNGATTSLKLGEESSELKFASGPDAGSVNFDDLANNADKKFLAVKGTIPKAGGYTMSVASGQLFPFFGDSMASVGGTVTKSAAQSTPDYKLGVVVTNVRLGDNFRMPRVELEKDGATYNIKESTAQLGPEGNSVDAAVTGSYNKDKTTLHVEVASTPWELLGGSKLKGNGDLTYVAEGKQVSGTVTLSTDAPIKAGGDSAVIYGPASDEQKKAGTYEGAPQITFGFAGSQDLKIGANATLVLLNPDTQAKTPITVGGNYDSGNKSFTLNGKQEGDPIEIVSGVKVKDAEFSASYKKVGTKSEVAAKLDVPEATVAMPSSGSDDPVQFGARVEYNPQGLAVFGKLANGWQVADGVKLDNTRIGYRSNPAAPAVPELSDGVENLPDVSNFQGMVAVGTLGLQEAGAMTGDYTAVARVDAKNKSYEAAIKKNDSLKLFGNPDANETSLKVDDANLRITKTPESGVTVALAGNGSLAYMSGETKQQSPPLVLGASYDAAAKRVVGGLAFDKKWENAAGVTGLALDKGSLDVVIDPTTTKASMVAAINAETLPGYFDKLGVEKSAPISFGLAFAKGQDNKYNTCANVSIGNATSTDAAIRPMADLVPALSNAMSVSYADLVVASGKCEIAGRELSGTSLTIKGDLLGVVPIDIALGVKPGPGGSAVLATPNSTVRKGASATQDSGASIKQASLGPATIEDAKLDFAVDTSKARQYELGLKGSLPIGKQKLQVSGEVKKGEGNVLNLALGATTKEFSVGGLKITDPSVTAGVAVDFSTPTAPKLADSMKINMKGGAELLGTKIDSVELGADYSGGTVQAINGKIINTSGIAVNNRAVLTGGGAVSWSAAEGTRAVLGDPETQVGAGLELCTGGVVTTGGKKACEGGNGYGITEAFVDMGPGWFNASGRLKVGDKLDARLSGAYFSKDVGEVTGISNDQKKFIINGKEVQPKAGDFKFGVEDVTVKTPVGSATGSVAVARYHESASSEAITEGRLAFEVPVMNQNVKFDGSYNTKGLYRIKAGAAGSIGGFTYTGEVYAANQYGPGAKRQEIDKNGQLVFDTDKKPVMENVSFTELTRNEKYDNNGKESLRRVPASIVNVDVTASLAKFGSLKLTGDYGPDDDGNMGARIKGVFAYDVSSGGNLPSPCEEGAEKPGGGGATAVCARVEYSSYPADAGFGFGFTYSVPNVAHIGFDGIFRKVNDQNLYRISGKAEMGPSSARAGGRLMLDNCKDVGELACAAADNTEIEVSASIPISGGLATVVVEGRVDLVTGDFRIVGKAYAGAKYGPWSVFGFIKAEAGFQVAIGVCFATKAFADSQRGCGKTANGTWAASVRGTAQASITGDFYFFSTTLNLSGEVKGIISSDNKPRFYARVDAFGNQVTFGDYIPDDELVA